MTRKLKNSFPVPPENEIYGFCVDAGEGDIAAVTAFLDKYGDAVDAEDGSGKTALVCAVVHGRKEMAAFLLDRGADIDKQSGEGHTALMNASINGAAMVAFLLERGADIEAKDNEGRTALMHARAYSTPYPSYLDGIIPLLEQWPEKKKQRELSQDIASFSPKLTRPMAAPNKLQPRPRKQKP